MTPDAVARDVAREVAGLRARQRKVDADAAKLQPRAYAAEDKAEATGKQADLDAALKLSRQLSRLVALGTALSEQIERTAGEAELARRVRAAETKEQNLARLAELREQKEAEAERDRAEEADDSASTDRPRRGRQTKGARMSTKKDEAAEVAAEQTAAEANAEPAVEEVAATNGDALYHDLIAKAEAVGEVVAHEKGYYARVRADGRTVAYIVPSKKGLRVYPQALAKAMPKDVGFRKVALGAHHFGRGEVIVPVEGEADLEGAVAAIAAAKDAPLERKATKKAKATAAK